jgi:murein L,D-transpeptidase YcbB/YkuD
MEDARVPRLRGRLGLASEASDLRYDPKLVDAVKEFQRANGLPATGNLDSRTVRKLNGPGADRTIETIIANMERWRWYPRDLGEAHVLVNLPDFTLKVMHKGAQIWTSRIVIGEPSKPTPLLSERMTSITLNPVWHVPPSIVRNEYLPALARDRNVLARMGLHLSYNGGEAQITMPAGGKTPLGHINFYNRFMVFQHDTPDQYMFAHAVRAESHGCMRVEHAAKYAELLFSLARPDEHWTAERVKTMFGGAEQELQLEPAPVWLHLTYQTALVDDDGKLQIRRDLYNLDRRTLAALKNEPVVAEPAPAASHGQELASASRHRRTARHSQGGDVVQSPFFAGPSNVRPRSGVRVLYR